MKSVAVINFFVLVTLASSVPTNRSAVEGYISSEQELSELRTANELKREENALLQQELANQRTVTVKELAELRNVVNELKRNKDSSSLRQELSELREKDASVQQELAELRSVNVLRRQKDAFVEQEFFELRDAFNKSIREKDTTVQQDLAELRSVNGLRQEKDASVEQELSELRSVVNKMKREVDGLSEYCRLISNGNCGPCLCRDDNRLVKKYYCDCQHIEAKRDCLDHYIHGSRISGIYKVHQNIMKTIQVYCDQTADGGGWTVIQRRRDGSVDFYRDWMSYKVGFGDLQNEFWMGNENLYTTAWQGMYPHGNELRFELLDWNSETRYAKYSKFELGSEATKYQLHVSGYSGSAGDGMANHNAMKFTTFDSDNDQWPNNCAVWEQGGWWYNHCHHANPNGKYYHYLEQYTAPAGSPVQKADGIEWTPWHGLFHSLKFVEMKMRRVR